MSDKLREILWLCYKISTESKADVFFNYSPHTDSYNVYYYIDGWKRNSNAEWVNVGANITDGNLDRTIYALRELFFEVMP